MRTSLAATFKNYFVLEYVLQQVIPDMFGRVQSVSLRLGEAFNAPRPRPHWTRRQKRSKLGHIAPNCNNSSIHITCTKQRIMQQASEWDVAPFCCVRFSRRVQCGRGLKEGFTNLEDVANLCGRTLHKALTKTGTFAQLSLVICVHKSPKCGRSTSTYL